VKTVILPSLYLPPAEIFLQMKDADELIIAEDDLWEKQTLRSRCQILGANGVQTLSIPVKHTGGVRKPVKDITISYSEAWVRIHKGAIFSAYNTSSFFTYFREDLFAIYDQQPKFLVDFNRQLLQLVLRKLKLNIKINTLSDNTNTIDLKEYTYLEKVKSQLAPIPPYPQVFSYKTPFQPTLSILDLLSNKGGW
jgi:hypothetical protein